MAYERSVVQLEFITRAADGLLLYQGPLIEGLHIINDLKLCRIGYMNHFAFSHNSSNVTTSPLKSEFFISVSAGGSRDFMAIVLYGGFIRLVISLGAKPLILTMSRGVRLDDGEWHLVEVRQELKVNHVKTYMSHRLR